MWQVWEAGRVKAEYTNELTARFYFNGRVDQLRAEDAVVTAVWPDRTRGEIIAYEVRFPFSNRRSYRLALVDR